MLIEPTTKIDTQELLTRLAPALAGGRLTEAMQITLENWTVPQLIALLDQQANPLVPPDVRKLAAAALGLVGDHCAYHAPGHGPARCRPDDHPDGRTRPLEHLVPPRQARGGGTHQTWQLPLEPRQF